MATSTLIALAGTSGNYIWDSVTGILFTANMIELLTVLLIVTGVISIIFSRMRKLF